MNKVDRIPLSRLEILQGRSAHVTPAKRSIKISNHKFPADFFINEQKLLNSKIIQREQPRTQQDIRLSLQRSPLKRREMSTALDCREMVKK